MATLGTRGMDEGGLAAELAVQIVAAARVAESIQTLEHIVLELRSDAASNLVAERTDTFTSGIRVALPMTGKMFNPAATMRSHESQATLQRLLNDGWKIDHSFSSTYVNKDDKDQHLVMSSTIIVLSRLHRKRVAGGYVLGSS